MRYSDFRREALKNEKVKKEYDDLEPEFQIIHALIENRIEKSLSQRDLAELTGIDRADISKIENANANPTLGTLKKLAYALDKKLVIQFK